MPAQPDSRDIAEGSTSTEQDSQHCSILPLGRGSSAASDTHVNPSLDGLQEGPSAHWARSSRGQRGPRYSPRSCLCSPQAINVEMDPRRGCPAFKKSPEPGTGHALREVGTVSITEMERST